MQRSASPDITDIGASLNRNVGRPRKPQPAPTPVTSQPTSSPQDVLPVPANDVPVPEQSPPPVVKRGRGRPKKSIDLVQPIPVSPATPPTPPPTGKRRGRKPKVSKETVESPNIDVSEPVPEDMDISDGPHQLTDLNIKKDGVDSVVTKMETEDIPETSSFFSSILKSEQPFGQQTGVGIPGLDLNDGDGSSNAPFVMDNPISFPFGASSGVEEECKSLQQLSISNKVKAPKSTVDTEVKTEEATDTNEENESSKVRRSSRIKTLEERGSRGRRREVVSSLSDCSGISRSNLSLNEDDSNSNSSFNTGGTTSGYSSPSREYAGSSLANSYSTPNLHALGTSSSANSSSKPLKVKSRWRYSLDAESLKSFNSSGDSGVSDSCAGSNAMEEFMRPENCVQRSGHLLFDGTDSELLEKLKRFEGIDESIYKNEGRKKLCKEGKGMSCDCQLTNEDLIRGETGCGDDCLNRLLMVECGNECVLGKRCSNKRFQRKEYAPLEVFKTEKKGHGLRTLNAINEGGFVIEYVGEVLDVNEFEKRTTAYAKGNLEHFYFMALKSDAIIDATQKGNCSRFINHSCEPNCETQKWTVNGEVRIGFFAIADLRPGDEITFDYQFQRYGKKAQRCFCMADSCRGWIGDEDDDAELAEEKEKDVSADVEEAEVEDSKVKPKPKAEKKKRKNVQLEDMAFREELAKLETSGLKNRNHTLTLSRLMVRAESWDDRERLLKVLINGGTPCRRLFLDYHGLRLIWSWMVDLPLPHENGGPQLIRNDIYHTLFLQALQSLPIPNKTILLESKVLSLIEKWCTVPPVTTSITLVKRTEAPVQVDVKIPAVDSAAAEEVIVKTEANEEKMDTSEIKEEPTSTVEGMQELVEEQTWAFVAISKSVLDSWADLKEVFRIPKKERVEQMKEHEREADKGQQLSQPSVTTLNNSYERDHRNKQMHRNRGERRVPVLDPTQNQFHRFQNRMVMPPGFSKEEWRRQFEQTVKQQEEQELLRKQQDALVILHQERCALVGLDPSITPIVDPHGVHYLDPKTVMWRPINVEDPSMPPELIKFLQLSQHPAPASDIPLVEPLVIVPEVESETGYPPWPEGLPGPPPLPPRELPKNWKMAIDDEGRCYYYHTRTKVTRWDPPNPYDVSSSESSESSTEEEEEEDKIEEASEGSPSISKASIQTWRTKLIERAERRKKTGLVQERIISPRGEDDKGFSKEMVKENKKKVLEEKLAARLAMKSEENSETETLTPTAESKKDNATEIEKDTKSVVARKVSHPPRKKSSSQGRSRRKDKQVSSKSAPKPKPKVTSRPDDSARTSASSSPIETELDLTLSQQNLDEDDETFLSRVPPTAGPSRIITSTPSMDVVIPGLGYDSRDIKHMKDKKVADKADRAARHAAKKKAMHQKKAKEKAAAEAADKDKRVSSKEASCIKDSFRNSIATVVVAHLNPYRKNEHIKNTDDFKHLARKITHAILLKELKHTRDVHSLEVTDSVKHKTKEYIKKFMARFPHGVYIRSPEQTQSK